MCQLIGAPFRKCVLIPWCHTNFQFYRFDYTSFWLRWVCYFKTLYRWQVPMFFFICLTIAKCWTAGCLAWWHSISTEKKTFSSFFLWKKVFNENAVGITVCCSQMIYDVTNASSKAFLDCNLSWEYQMATMDFTQNLNYLFCDGQWYRLAQSVTLILSM